MLAMPAYVLLERTNANHPDSTTRAISAPNPRQRIGQIRTLIRLPLRFPDDPRRISKLSIVASLLAPGYQVFALENGCEIPSDSGFGLSGSMKASRGPWQLSAQVQRSRQIMWRVNSSHTRTS